MLSVLVSLYLLGQVIQVLLLAQGLHLTDLLSNGNLFGFYVLMSLLHWLLVSNLSQRLLLMSLFHVL